MKMRHPLLFFLILGVHSISSAGQIDVVINPGMNWELRDEARTKFNHSLENERLRLLKNIPDLDFPKAFESVKAGIPQYMSADSPQFRNRKAACSFLEKMRKNLEPNKRPEMDSLTKSGKICIQADLPQAEQLEWTQNFARLIWNAKWIAWKNEILSLQSYLEKTIGDTHSFVTPQISIMKKGSFDGWGIAQSKKDLDFFASIAPIKKAFAAAADFDPNNPNTFDRLGSEFKKFIEEDPFNAANLLIGQPTIYLSNGWPPNAMVELLAHEYGHIYRRRESQHYSGNKKQLEWLNDEVHEEAAAESFAWMTLAPLYDIYPEIEIFHISKLIFMNQFSPNNFHYIGAAGFQDVFYTSKMGQFDELRVFDSAPDLLTYLSERKISSLKSQGARQKRTVRAVF